MDNPNPNQPAFSIKIYYVVEAKTCKLHRCSGSFKKKKKSSAHNLISQLKLQCYNVPQGAKKILRPKNGIAITIICADNLIPVS